LMVELLKDEAAMETEEFWVRLDLDRAPWLQVSREEYCRLERLVGFNGPQGVVATAAFSAGGVRGQTWRPDDHRGR